jgi:hypothetical protein
MSVSIVHVVGGMFHIEKDVVFEMGGKEMDGILLEYLAQEFDRSLIHSMHCPCFQLSSFQTVQVSLLEEQEISLQITSSCPTDEADPLHDGFFSLLC